MWTKLFYCSEVNVNSSNDQLKVTGEIQVDHDTLNWCVQEELMLFFHTEAIKDLQIVPVLGAALQSLHKLFEQGNKKC